MYLDARISAGLSRERAADLVYCGSRSLQDYENFKTPPGPETVVNMAKAYHRPDLPPWHCKNNCPIGQVYDHDITKKTLTTAVVQLLNAINGIEQECKILIKIAADEQVTEDEIEDLTLILHRLSKVEHKIGNLKVSVSDTVPVEVIMGKEKQSAGRQARHSA